MWGSLWDSVRLTDFDPDLYARAALTALYSEKDESLTASLLAHTETAAHRYLSSGDQTAVLMFGTVTALDRMTRDPNHDLRIVWFRSLPGFAVPGLGSPEAGPATMKALLDGKATIPGVTLRLQDRWSLVTALIAYNDPDANAVFAAEQKRDPSGDGLKYAWVAQAARPDAATKQHYFNEYLHNPDRIRRLDPVLPLRLQLLEPVRPHRPVHRSRPLCAPPNQARAQNLLLRRLA